MCKNSVAKRSRNVSRARFVQLCWRMDDKRCGFRCVVFFYSHRRDLHKRKLILRRTSLGHTFWLLFVTGTCYQCVVSNEFPVVIPCGDCDFKTRRKEVDGDHQLTVDMSMMGLFDVVAGATPGTPRFDCCWCQCTSKVCQSVAMMAV